MAPSRQRISHVWLRVASLLLWCLSKHTHTHTKYRKFIVTVLCTKTSRSSTEGELRVTGESWCHHGDYSPIRVPGCEESKVCPLQLGPPLDTRQMTKTHRVGLIKRSPPPLHAPHDHNPASLPQTHTHHNRVLLQRPEHFNSFSCDALGTSSMSPYTLTNTCPLFNPKLIWWLTTAAAAALSTLPVLPRRPH